MNKKGLEEYALITFGIILVALSVEYFFAPNNLAAGGVTGLAIVINALLPNLSVGIITLVLNIVLKDDKNNEVENIKDLECEGA